MDETTFPAGDGDDACHDRDQHTPSPEPVDEEPTDTDEWLPL